MKLTNTMRDAFVRAAMDDVPSVDYTEQIRSLALAAALRVAPPAIQKAWADPELRPYINTSRLWVGGVTTYVPQRDGGTGVELLPEDNAEVLRLEKASDGQSERESALKEKLKGAAYGCSTRKALATMLPEFERYLPADDAVATRMLPVAANVVADFVKAGWPKGARKEATTA